MELKTLTIKEGILRALDGEDVIIMIPSQLMEHSVEDLRVLGRNGAFCVRAADLKPKADPEPHPYNDGGLYTMQAGVVETVTEEPEPEKPKKPKVDTGKIKALADAGWSVQKIAGEMGLSGPTIRRYLKEGLGE